LHPAWRCTESVSPPFFENRPTRLTSVRTPAGEGHPDTMPPFLAGYSTLTAQPS